MPGVAVVTDTTHYLPADVVARHDLHLVSLYVNWAGRTDRESDLPDYDAFYDHMRSATDLPSTSQPSVGDFLAVYEPLLAAGKEVVSIHIAGGISGTCQAARQARDQLQADGRGGERIHVFDSRTGAGAQGLLVLAAGKAAAGGASGEEALLAAEHARGSLKIWFAVDTLEYLRKGGRIGAAQALLGSALQIKPILTLEEEITPVERVRTSRRAFERMVEYARERQQDGAGTWVVQHIQDPETARKLVDECRQVFGSDPVFVSEIGPVLGAHTGPGLLGIGGIATGELD